MNIIEIYSLGTARTCISRRPETMVLIQLRLHFSSMGEEGRVFFPFPQKSSNLWKRRCENEWEFSLGRTKTTITTRERVITLREDSMRSNRVIRIVSDQRSLFRTANNVELFSHRDRPFLNWKQKRKNPLGTRHVELVWTPGLWPCPEFYNTTEGEGQLFAYLINHGQYDYKRRLWTFEHGKGRRSAGFTGICETESNLRVARQM